MNPEDAAPDASPALGPHTRLGLAELSIRTDEDGECIVGSLASGRFVGMPALGARVIELLREGLTLREAEERLARDEEAEVDVAAFAEALVEYGFVREVDGRPLDAPGGLRPNLAWLEARHVAWMFSLPALLAYGALLAAGLVTLLFGLRWRPRYDDFFWVAATSITLTVNTAVYFGVLAVHELMHLVAARSLGVPARINLSTRLHNLVVQTDVTGLWSVPRGKRYRVYAAGMASDLGFVAVSALLLAYAPLPPLAQGLLRALVLMCFIGLCWQLQFFMRTDVYFIVMDLLRCKNLFENAVAVLRHRAGRLRRKLARAPLPDRDADPLAELPAHERWRVRLYAVVVLFGSAWALGVFALFGLPILVEMFVRAVLALAHGVRAGEAWAFADGAATIVIEGGLQGLFVVTFVRQRWEWFASLGRRLRGGHA